MQRLVKITYIFPILWRAWVAQWVRQFDYLTTHTSLSPIWRGFAPGFVNYKKGCIWLAATSDKVYQLLVHGRCFSPGTLASSTTKTGRHDIAEILLKVALKHQKSNQIKNLCEFSISYKIIHWFYYKVQICTKFKKIILNIFSLSIGTGNCLLFWPTAREITPIKTSKNI